MARSKMVRTRVAPEFFRYSDASAGTVTCPTRSRQKMRTCFLTGSGKLLGKAGSSGASVVSRTSAVASASPQSPPSPSQLTVNSEPSIGMSWMSACDAVSGVKESPNSRVFEKSSKFPSPPASSLTVRN